MKFKKICLIKFFILLNLISTNIFAEAWVCSYVAYDEKKITDIYIRKDDGKFVQFFEEFEFPLTKTFEDDTYLHLVLSYENILDARVINKITGKVESVGIKESESQVVQKIYGTCKAR